MKAASLVIGFVVLGVAWVGQLSHLAKDAFFAHMTVHIGVVAVAAPLLSLGIAGTRFDPVSKAGALFSPIPASMLELFVVWAWHAPAAQCGMVYCGAGSLPGMRNPRLAVGLRR